MAILIRKATEDDINNMKHNPTWECEVSDFDWYYNEEEESYFVEGDVIVHYEGERVSFGKGDYVVFPKGLACRWQVKKPVKKHYIFK